MSNQDKLLEEINNNPLFQIKNGNERLEHKEELIKLEEKIFKQKGFLKQSRKLTEETYGKYLNDNANLNHPEKIFFPDAFEVAIKKSVQKYNPQKGIFIGYFNTIYRNEARLSMQKELSIYSSQPSISGYETKLLGKVMSLLKDLQKLHHSIAVDEFVPEIAEMLNISQKKVRWLLQMSNPLQSLDELTSESNNFQAEEDCHDKDEYEDFAEETPNDNSFSTPVIELMITFITASGLTVKNREYYKLFLTNSLLKPLKQTYSKFPDDKNKAVPKDYQNHMAYKQTLEEVEPLLYENIFDLPYLLFVFRQPPTPDSIDHIDQCSFQSHHDPRTQKIVIVNLDEKTVSLYKAVSKPYVSKQMKGYQEVLNQALQYYKKIR